MTQHTENSSYREKLIEHLFIGELLKVSWLHFGCTLEISRPEVDNSGFDVIAEVPGVVRHLQLKASIAGGKTALQKVHTKLAQKPSGCVIWIYFDGATMRLGPFRYFGGSPGERLPSLETLRVGRHSKGNKDGFKAERPSIRELPRSRFRELKSIDEVYVQLFGT